MLLGATENVSLAQVSELIEEDADRLHLVIEIAPGGQDRVLYRHPVGFLTLGEVRERVTWGSFEVVVGPQWQGRGYGRRVLAQVPGLLMSWRGLSTIKVGAFEDNGRALALYRSLGFSEVESVWYSTLSGRRRAVLLSNRPEAFLRRRAGFS